MQDHSASFLFARLRGRPFENFPPLIEGAAVRGGKDEGPGRAKGPGAARSSPEGGREAAGNDSEAERQIRRIVASPSYVRADFDTALLARDELRPIRLQLEFLKPELLLAEHGVRSTIVVFGGTRIVEPERARRMVAEAERELGNRPDDEGLGRRLEVAKRVLDKSHYYDMAREFGRLVSKTCQRTPQCEFVITTGGGPGIMEAANRGAFDAGSKSIGLNINLPHEQEPNPYITPDLCFQFRYFALRKMHFLRRARALVAFPGGYGTLDELSDALCLIQTRKMPPLPIVLVGEAYWRRVFDVDFLAAEGVIAPEDVDIFCYAESAPEIWQRIVAFWRARGEEVPNGER
jgi:uncharacterized protein (TIGR00730 family)